MIATVQNTTRRVTIDGKQVEVWEALAQSGIRFHLFVLGAAPMDPVNVKKPTGPGIGSGMPKYLQEIRDEKPPCSETALLPEVVRLAGI